MKEDDGVTNLVGDFGRKGIFCSEETDSEFVCCTSSFFQLRKSEKRIEKKEKQKKKKRKEEKEGQGGG